MGKLFGTDGIRGIANKEITPFLALKTGIAVAKILTKNTKNKKAKVFIGKDTRISSDDLFHFGKFNSEASDLDLGILSADDLDISIRKVSCHISGMIQNLIAFGIIINILCINLSRFLRLIEISSGNLEA